MPTTFKLEGLDDLLRKLDQLPDRVVTTALRRSLRKGGNVIKQAAVTKARALDDPATPQRIDENIVVQNGGRQFERREGGPAVRVGVLGGARKYADTRFNRRKGKVGQQYETAGSRDNPGGDTWYWRFLEFGTSKMHARPFMRPAMDEGAGAAFEAIAADMPAQIDKELAKLK